MFPATHVSASVFLQVLGRPEALGSFSPPLVDGLPERTVGRKAKVQLSAQQPPDCSSSFQAHLRLTIWNIWGSVWSQEPRRCCCCCCRKQTKS